MNDDIDIQRFALTVINDDTFKRKFFSSFISMYAADGLCFSIEKVFKDAGDKFSDDEKKSVAEAIARLRETIKSDKIDDIKKDNEALMKAWEPLAKKMYANGAAPGGQPQFTQEQMDQMMKDPKFAEMFKGAGNSTFAFTPPAGGAAENGKKDGGPDTVDAEIVD